MSRRSEPEAGDKQPPWWHISVSRPPWWIFLMALVAAVGTGIWGVISNTGAGPSLLLGRLVWPGLAIAAVVFVVAWMGWGLDLE